MVLVAMASCDATLPGDTQRCEEEGLFRKSGVTRADKGDLSGFATLADQLGLESRHIHNFIQWSSDREITAARTVSYGRSAGPSRDVNAAAALLSILSRPGPTGRKGCFVSLQHTLKSVQ